MIPTLSAEQVSNEGMAENHNDSFESEGVCEELITPASSSLQRLLGVDRSSLIAEQRTEPPLDIPDLGVEGNDDSTGQTLKGMVEAAESTTNEKRDLEGLLSEYQDMFLEKPGRTNLVVHDRAYVYSAHTVQGVSSVAESARHY